MPQFTAVIAIKLYIKLSLLSSVDSDASPMYSTCPAHSTHGAGFARLAQSTLSLPFRAVVKFSLSAVTPYNAPGMHQPTAACRAGSLDWWQGN